MPVETTYEHTLELQVAQALRDANYNYQTQVVVGQTRPDFLITTDTGDQIVVDVKGWDRGTHMAARAINQAQRYKELSKVAAALVVTPAVVDTIVSATVAVAPMGDFLNALSTLISAIAARNKPPRPQPVSPAPKKTVFASMPFALQYDDTFLVAIEPASLNNGASAERVDHNGIAGPVVPQIHAKIKAAKVIVADLSESRPNVLHEIGYAEALRKTIIQICSTPVSALPFNVRNNQTITYTIGQTAKLRKTLDTEIAPHI
jgi:hypothetical protein